MSKHIWVSIRHRHPQQTGSRTVPFPFLLNGKKVQKEKGPYPGTECKMEVRNSSKIDADTRQFIGKLHGKVPFFSAVASSMPLSTDPCTGRRGLPRYNLMASHALECHTLHRVLLCVRVLTFLFEQLPVFLWSIPVSQQLE